MKLPPRAKLALLALLFLSPIVASGIAYVTLNPEPTANYGELILPPAVPPAQPMLRSDAQPFAWSQLSGKWVIVANDSGTCPASCEAKLVAMRQVRVALGRNASRIERLFIVDDGRLAPEMAKLFPGMVVATMPAGARVAAGVAGDREHLYLIDPHGNVMMRWPAIPDGKRMIRDLDRLLRASQIG